MIQPTIRLATLNCRGLRKINNNKKRSSFIRYLRTLGYDILILQETHALHQQIIDEFNLQFRTTSSHWTQHCGIVSLNNRYSIQLIQDGIDEGRFILANIQLTSSADSDASNRTTIATILNIYGRSGSHPQRSAFYSELLTFPLIIQALTSNLSTPTLIMGDFNYSYEKHRREDGSLTSAPPSWISLLEEHYIDCFKDDKQPTWQLASRSSILDFIFCDTASHSRVDDLDSRHLSKQWTDHTLLGLSLRYDDPTSCGPGAWKANPFLAKSKAFRAALAKHLETKLDDFTDIQSFSSPQQSWDWIKGEVKLFIKSYQLADTNWRVKQLKKLQKKRNMMLRQKKNRGLYFQVLETIEMQIGSLQESFVEIEALKAGKTWREKGEKYAGYIKRTAVTRETQRSIHALIDPITNVVYDDQPNKLRIAKDYYTDLFTPDLVDLADIQELLSSVPTDLRLDSSERDLLTSSIDFEDILEVLKTSPRKSSPGSDGLPFEILNLVIRFPAYQELLLTVFNNALDQAIFPDSWNESIMTLLKKKGDSKAMGNYRPLSLANCDYKCFTKILNQRMMEVSTKLINCNQIGFIPGKYIAENGMRCQLIMEDAALKWTLAEQRDSPGMVDRDIGLLLDQEKAYDRVNLSYFRAVLNRFGFPSTFVNCIYNMMAKNRIKININGFFTGEVLKTRGFKQGDPISCICYDLAFEPFLQSILQDPDYHGYQLGSLSSDTPATISPINTKLLCYADDALVFVHDQQDLRLLSYYMDLFCRASNARFNYTKVEAFSVSGRDTSRFWHRPLTNMNIHHLHTAKDATPIIYLGFPLIQSTQQRLSYVNSLIGKLKQAIQIHSCRSLSVMGKATVVNTLILSKCWYIFRVTPLTEQDLQRITSVAIQFLKKGIFPVIPWRTWTLPRDHGGLGILDVKLQYSALYFRWIQPLLFQDSASSTNNPLIAMLIHTINNHNDSRSHHIPLLLPVARRLLTTKRRVSTIDMLYKSVDKLHRDFDLVSINHLTGLDLPLNTVLFRPIGSSFRIPQKIKEMFVADLFQFNSQLQLLHWKHISDPTLTKWKQAPKQIFTGIASGALQLQPFFLPLCSPASTTLTSDTTVSFLPFAAQLQLPRPLQSSSSKVSSKSFRQACSSIYTAPPHLSCITTDAWQFFWRLSLTMIQRNVIYRLINNCIPHQALLHRMFPDVHLSPLCVICSLATDSVDHFLFFCPSKALVWQGIITEFLWPTVCIADIRHSLLHLDFYNIRYSQKPRAPSYIIVIITLANIWKAHYRLIFHQQPFIPSAILRGIRLDIDKMLAEDTAHSQL